MPDAIRYALKCVIMKGGEKTSEEADEYILNMDRSHRYQAETWS